MHANLDNIKQDIMDLIRHSANRHTSLTIEKHILSNKPDVTKKTLSRSINELILNGDLIYTYEYGSSFLELSFEKPVRVSDHVVIKPDRCEFSALNDDIVISLQKGASFGSGSHPSTQLALKALESIRSSIQTGKDHTHRHALDIGTGSGILAIAAVLMGVGKALGLDIDPCAISEAKQNVQTNNLTRQVIIDNRPVDTISETFFLILANLRFPTLADLCLQISTILEQDGMAVFSGLKSEEINPLTTLYQKHGMKKICAFSEKGWGSIVLHKTGELHDEQTIQF